MLPNGKPVVYRIHSDGGKNNYTGIAKRWCVQERLAENLPGGKDHEPGAKVQIEQQRTIDQAHAIEGRVIARGQPKYNRQGK